MRSRLGTHLRLTTAFLTLVALVSSVGLAGAAGWTGCSDGSASPGNRTGCSVRYAGYYCWADGTCTGAYEYTCGGTTTTCWYQYPEGTTPDEPSSPSKEPIQP